MSEISQLVPQLVQFLAPFLPYLLKAGEKAAEEAGKKLGGDAWEQAKALWTKLQGKKKVAKVAETAAALPDNAALKDALREEIARALAEDEVLATEIARLLKAAGVRIESDVKAGDVGPEGEVTGVEAKHIAKGEVKSRVKTGDVEGKVTGVSADEIGV